MITASGRRLLGLIDDILDFSKLQNRDLPIEPVPVDIHAAADTVLGVLAPLAEKKSLVLENRISERLPRVLGDEMRIGQILYNLLGNAIKFTERGRITVRAEAQDGMLKIQVTDTGIGIDEKEIVSIFKAFEQAGGGDNTAGGTGLGLAITRHLVELHTGRIGVVSKEGEGSTFWFTLPVTERAPVSGPPVETASAPPLPVPVPPAPVVPGGIEGRAQNGSRIILCVDDDPVNLQVAVSHLSFLEDVQVHTAMDGPGALVWIAQHPPPDLLLLDIMMPGMTGTEVCRRLRRKYPPQKLPIIMLTAKNRIRDLVEGFAGGASDYLAKPFEKDELLARVATQLALKKAFDTYAENLRLKKEIHRRKRTESDLRRMQQRLSRILDTVDGAMVAANENLEICFVNRDAGTLLGRDPAALLGTPVVGLFTEKNHDRVEGMAREMLIEPRKAENSWETAFRLRGVDRKSIPCSVDFTPLEMEAETLMVLTMVPAKGGRPGPPAAHGPALALVREIGRTRQKIRTVEEALGLPGPAHGRQPLGRHLQALQEVLSGMEIRLAGAPDDVPKKQAGVEAMNMALEIWKETTGRSKADLAEQSGLWKVYVTCNGHARTQTLDKYLDIRTLPKNPRWQNVAATVDFVLSACDASPRQREELTQKSLLLKIT